MVAGVPATRSEKKLSEKKPERRYASLRGTAPEARMLCDCHIPPQPIALLALGGLTSLDHSLRYSSLARCWLATEASQRAPRWSQRNAIKSTSASNPCQTAATPTTCG